MTRSEVPARPSDAIELKALSHGKYRVFESGQQRWRYRDGKLVVYIKYPADYGEDGVYGNFEAVFWDAPGIAKK